MRANVRRLGRKAIAIPIILGALLTAGVVIGTSDLLREALPWARPQSIVGETAAAATAEQKLRDLRPELTGWSEDSIERGRFSEIRDLKGNVLAKFDEEIDAWLVRFSADAQAGYAVNQATIVVDAETGEVRSASIAGWNP